MAVQTPPKPPMPEPDIEAGVIEDGRSREQRERRGVAAIFGVLLVAGFVYLLVSGGGGDANSGHRPRVPR